MAVNFVARKCTQCAGKLQYIKEKKIWQCLYCGAEIEREEQYDGLFTIKNVVRQSLLDLSYRRLDSASKNLIECEKIDSRYVGTLIAKIAYAMIMMITPDACSEHDAKNLFAQLKKTYEQLKNIGQTITEDEEALYEFLEESDIYATLVLVFDSLGDEKRREFVSMLLNPKEIYSKVANNNLLTFAIKNSRYELGDQILSNTDNIDVKLALMEVLEKYPDNQKKSKHIQVLFKIDVFEQSDNKMIENYLISSSDCVETKIYTLVASLESGMYFGFEMIIEQILKKATKEQVQLVVATLCTNKLTDEQVHKLIDFAFISGEYEIVICVLECLKQSDQYWIVSSKLLISVLNMNTYVANEKIEILKKCFEFKIDSKALEAVVTHYLCYNSSPLQERKVVLPYLFEKNVFFPTSMVETYVLNVAVDGEEKPSIISTLFHRDLNISFFHDLLSKYMNSNKDKREVKTKVIDVLSEKGLKISPSSFVEYICESVDEVQVKIQFIKKMIQNGSQLRGDTASLYLEKISPNEFSSELFSLIFLPSSTFSASGIEKYIFHIKDRGANKVSNLKTMVEHSDMGIISLQCQVQHLGNTVNANVLQAYLLTTTDSQQLALEIVDYFVNGLKLKINAPISVLGNSMKLKKYVVANKSNLSEITNMICEKYKVYSMFFS